MKDENAQQHRSDCSDASPNRVGDADWDGLSGFGQKYGTQHIKHGKTRNPLFLNYHCFSCEINDSGRAIF